MSTETYLKGDDKEKALDLIRKYMAYRMTSDEMLTNLKDKGYEISERTLRRYKQEIKKKSGSNITEIFQNEVVDNALEDIFALRELERQGWKEYNNGKSSSEKLKALNLVRNSVLDKVKLYGHIPLKFRFGQSPKKKTSSTNSGGDSSKPEN